VLIKSRSFRPDFETSSQKHHAHPRSFIHAGVVDSITSLIQATTLDARRFRRSHSRCVVHLLGKRPSASAAEVGRPPTTAKFVCDATDNQTMHDKPLAADADSLWTHHGRHTWAGIAWTIRAYITCITRHDNGIVEVSPEMRHHLPPSLPYFAKQTSRKWGRQRNLRITDTTFE
jgi:hypothetical protein